MSPYNVAGGNSAVTLERLGKPIALIPMTRINLFFLGTNGSLVAAVLIGSCGAWTAVADDAASVRAADDLSTATGPMEPVVPAAWAPPRGGPATIDFAVAAQADAWLRHVALGDPSFDSFQHAAGNPMLRGTPPFLWPVNGFLFEDPKSGHWYAYVGEYLAGYDVGPGKPITHCTVHRSKDRGKTWEHLGPIFRDPEFRFEGDSQPANIAPDVSVVFDGGRYHLAYDWGTDNSTWATIGHPGGGADNGNAYAWADRPEGPFHRHGQPILRTSEFQAPLSHGLEILPHLRRHADPAEPRLADTDAHRRC